jgi:hypothetical protein
MTMMKRHGVRQQAPHEHAEIQGPGGQRRREQPEHQRGLGQRGNRHIAAGTHSAERTAGIERRRGEREAAERERTDEQEDAARRLERRSGDDYRNEGRGRDSGGEIHSGTGHVNPRRGLRSNRFLAKQLGQVVVTLPPRRSLTILEPRFHLSDGDFQERGQRDHTRSLQHHADRQDRHMHHVVPPSHSSSSTPSTST